MGNHNEAPNSFPSPLRWIPEFLELGKRRLRSQARLLGATILVGIVAGLGAVLFYVMCQVVVHFALDGVAGFRPQEPLGESRLAWLPESDQPLRPWLLALVPAIGGLVSGVLVFRLAPEAEGHGTDAVIDAYHRQQGQIRSRVPLVKMLASAITIGTGGSGGREGPIAQIGAGFGSFLGSLLRLRPAERRILVAAGMGAGVAAIFRAPLAGALFAAEVLYWSPEFEAEVILPAALASVVAYSTFGSFFGWKPLFGEIGDLQFAHIGELGPYTLLALLVVVLAAVYTRTFYGTRNLFHRLPVATWIKPTIGALLNGLLGVGLFYLLGQKEQTLSVMSFGYGILQDAMSREESVTSLVLLTVALGKIATTSLTIGSGGSGGVFGPSMVIGGCAGGSLGLLLHGVWPGLVPHPASFMIVGMAGFFAAAAKTPFSTLVIVSEMTGSYGLLLPALWVCVLSFLLSDEQSIYRSQVESRSRSPAHKGSYVRDVLQGMYVGQFVKSGTEFPVLRLNDSLDAVIRQLTDSTYTVLPVVDDKFELQGVVNLEEVHLASQSDGLRNIVLAADLMRTEVLPLSTDDGLDRALELFVENDLLALPIVDGSTNRRVVGIARRSEIASHYLRHVHG